MRGAGPSGSWPYAAPTGHCAKQAHCGAAAVLPRAARPVAPATKSRRQQHPLQSLRIHRLQLLPSQAPMLHAGAAGPRHPLLQAAAAGAGPSPPRSPSCSCEPQSLQKHCCRLSALPPPLLAAEAWLYGAGRRRAWRNGRPQGLPPLHGLPALRKPTPAEWAFSGIIGCTGMCTPCKRHTTGWSCTSHQVRLLTGSSANSCKCGHSLT